MKEVVGAFIIKKNKFLFGKRVKTKKWAPDKWDIMGGHVKENETPLKAMQREINEECGIKVIQAQLMGEFIIPDDSLSENFRYFIYLIILWKGKAINCSDEHEKLKWFTKKQLKKKKLALELYLELMEKLSMNFNVE